MVEKRRGLGRGLGALIPSAPAVQDSGQNEEAARPEETVATDEPMTPAPKPAGTPAQGTATAQAARPADLFFERVTSDDIDSTPRSYSSALKSGIDKNVRDAQTKRVAKKADRRSSDRSRDRDGTTRNGSARSDSVVDTDDVPDQHTSATAMEQRASDGELQIASRVSRETGAARDKMEMTLRAEPETSEGLVDVPGASFAELDLGAIHPNRKQPRTEFDADELEELVHSIREVGVLQPVVVRPSQEGGEVSYELVMGERRWRASREAGLETIPAIIRSTQDDDLLRDALLENLHRSALNPLEEAAAYQQLLDDFGCSHDELAGRLGRSRPQISNTLRLLRLPPLVQRRVAAGVLTAGHSRALLGLNDPAAMEQLAQRIVSEGLSVRSTEEIVALSSGLRQVSKPSKVLATARHERLDYLATSLSDRLDTNVKISLGAKKGRVSIEFASVDDLNRIIGVISPPNE